jgi:hypothetical protein
LKTGKKPFGIERRGAKAKWHSENSASIGHRGSSFGIFQAMGKERKISDECKDGMHSDQSLGLNQEIQSLDSAF